MTTPAIWLMMAVDGARRSADPHGPAMDRSKSTPLDLPRRHLVEVHRYFEAVDRSYVEARPLRSARPANIPVCLPLSTTTWPLTIT